MAIQTRGKIAVYAKAHTATPAAFVAGDRLSGVMEVTTSATSESFDWSTYDQAATFRVADLKDSQITMTLVADPDDTSQGVFRTAYASVERTLDILVVRGDAPAAAAKNIVTYGTYVISEFSYDQPLPGVVQSNVTLDIADGATYVEDVNAVAFPSL